MSSVHGDDNISLAHAATLASFLSPSLRGDLPAPQTSQVDKGITSSLDSHQQTCCREVQWQEDSVFLTWQDLWVTVSAANDGNRPILQGLTGYAQPGEMLAIMGPSGCGKSTLLDALAGRLDLNTKQFGQILVNGRKQRLAFGTSAYVTQDDTLMATLTVREAIYYSALLQLPESMSGFEKRERTETTIREMGLQDVMNTKIGGGWGNKGISGGQRRRVSICIEILTRPKLLFLDEPTSGLDSAASYHVMKKIVDLAIQDGRTVIASIHQPSTQVFQLFDNLYLLSSGKTIYFGPASVANEFFSLNGFPCPTTTSPSDHYLDTINTDFDRDFEQEDCSVSITTAKEAIKALVTSYMSSTIRGKVDEQIAEILKVERGAMEKGIQSSFIAQALVLTRRSFVNMNRDIGYHWLRFGIYIALSLTLGNIFYNINHSYSSIQARGSMLMFVATFFTFMAIGGFPSFVEDMKIFERERLNGHYGVAAFVVGNTISSIPYMLLNSVGPGAIAYYLVGLQRGVDHFVYYSLVVFTCTLLIESMMMMIASTVPDFLMGIIVGSGLQGAMILTGGFFRLPNDLPNPLWKYPLYYISFHKYAYEGLFKNEYEGLSFPNLKGAAPPTISGESILESAWQMQMYSKWVDLFVLMGMVVVYRLMFFGIIKVTEKMKPFLGNLLSNSNKKTDTVMVEPSPLPTHARGATL